MFLIDLHVHTNRYSPCAVSSAIEMMRAAVLAGLDGIAITEHWHKYDRELLHHEREKAGASDLIVLVGAELSSDSATGYPADFLVFGCSPPVGPGEYVPSEQLVELIHQAGGIVIPAHPFRFSSDVGRLQAALPVDAIEVLNSNCDDLQSYLAHEAAISRSLPEVAGSDAHETHRVGRYSTAFERPVTTEEELIAAVKEGACWPHSSTGELEWAKRIASGRGRI